MNKPICMKTRSSIQEFIILSLQVLRDLASKNKEDETFPATFGKLPYNVKKNRYRDIVPCKYRL